MKRSAPPDVCFETAATPDGIPVVPLGEASLEAWQEGAAAALFLQRFVEQRDRWMHFDIFAWNPVRKPGRPKGGEGSALRAAFGLIEKLAAGEPPGGEG